MLTNAFATSFAPMLKVYTNPKMPPAMAIHRYSCNVPLILFCWRGDAIICFYEHWRRRKQEQGDIRTGREEDEEEEFASHLTFGCDGL